MKLTRFTRLACAAAVSTLAVTGFGVLAGPVTTAFAAGNGGQTQGTGGVTGTIAPVGSATFNPTDTQCSAPTGQCVQGPLTGFSVTLNGAFGSSLSNTGLVIAECTGDADNAVNFPEPSGATGPGQCFGTNEDLNSSTDINGNLTNYTYSVAKITPTSAGGCDATHACTIYVGPNVGDFSQPHLLFDFNFPSPPASAVAPTAASEPSTQSMSAQQGGSAAITVTYGTANDTKGHAETIDPSTSTVTTNPAHGTITGTAPTFTYHSTTGTTATTDSFVVSGATASCPAATGGPCASPATAQGPPITVNVTLTVAPSHSQACDATTGAGTTGTPPAGSCSIDQVLTVPLTAGDLTMSENGTPVGGPQNPPLTPAGDVAGAGGLVTLINGTVAGGSCTATPAKITGQPIDVCGNIAPVTVVNARGTAANWTLSGQVTDFVDPVLGVSPATNPCDTIATYSSHCIPGGNLGWTPAAAVAHDIVPGDVAAVTAGSPVGIAPASPVVPHQAPVPATGALTGKNTQADPVAELAPIGGLHNGIQTLCSTASNTSGGTFDCGAAVQLWIPASAALPQAPGYEAILTLTLLG